MKRDTAIITGGAKRLGAEIARFFAAKGFDIALHYNRSSIEAEKTKAAIEMIGTRCRLFKADLNDTAAPDNLIKEIFSWSDTVSVLVNNASVFDRGTFLETDAALLDREYAINFKAPFLITRTFVKRANKGVIINMLDSRVMSRDTGYHAYTLSKKMLYEHTMMAALELAPDFRVNGICPGPILPPSGSGTKPPDVGQVPLKRTGRMDEIMKAIEYLLQNEFVTGECLFVDGGKKLTW